MPTVCMPTVCMPHKKSVTVSELSDYLTRREKKQYLNEAQNGCTLSRIRIVPTGQGRNQPLYEHHMTKSGRNRVK